MYGLHPKNMSLFRKPKKIQRRVFSSALDEEDENAADDMEMEIDGEQSVQNNKKSKDGGAKKSSNKTDKIEEPKSKALLSFADDGRFYMHTYFLSMNVYVYIHTSVCTYVY